jgi:sugar diacid utilization regulator
MPVAAMIKRLEDALGMRIELAASVSEGALATPIEIDGEPSGALAIPAGGEAGADSVRLLLLHRVARAVEHLENARQRAADAPVQTRAELLNELLAREPNAARDLVRRARGLDIPIDGWHVVIRLELENLSELRADDEVGVLGLTQLAARLATEATGSRAGAWNRAGTGATILLIHSRQAEAGPELQDAVARTARAAIARVRSVIPLLTMRCGVGGVHAGPTGLRTSAMEARAAVAAALTTNRPNVPVRFDSTGLRRVLLQWYALDDARDSVARILEPLDRLGPAKSREAIRTLRAYLDGHRSLNRAAATLGLHRNTVRYRVERTFETLGVDPEDAEQCLMLQLACRAREL